VFPTHLHLCNCNLEPMFSSTFTYIKMPFTDDDEIMPLLPGVYSNVAFDSELAEPPPAYVASSQRAVPDILPAYASSSRESEEVELPPYVPHSHYQYSSLATQNRIMQPASKPTVPAAPRPTMNTTGVYINGPRAPRVWRMPARRRGCPCCCGMPPIP